MGGTLSEGRKMLHHLLTRKILSIEYSACDYVHVGYVIYNNQYLLSLDPPSERDLSCLHDAISYITWRLSHKGGLR